MLTERETAELEIMLDDHGLEAVLDAVTDCLERQAACIRGVRPGAVADHIAGQAHSLRVSSEAIVAGRAPTWLWAGKHRREDVGPRRCHLRATPLITL
jgi:hypothetical protein